MDSYLMWSHYGKHHTQLCFEIDFSKNKYLGGPSEIYYPDDLINYRKEQNNPDANMSLYLATTKIKQWSYEKEVRLIIDITYPGVDQLLINFCKGDDFAFAKFDLKFISKVVFGINANKDVENKAIEMFSRLGLSPVFEKMAIDAVTLKLKAIDYNLYYQKAQ